MRPTGVAETLSAVPLIENWIWLCTSGRVASEGAAKPRKARLGDALIAQSASMGGFLPHARPDFRAFAEAVRLDLILGS